MPSMRPAYGIDRGDLLRAATLGVWLLLCDAALKLVARVGACGSARSEQPAAVRDLLQSTDSCRSLPLVGDLVQLTFARTEAAMFGLVPGTITGHLGLVHAGVIFGLAAVLTVAVMRWRWRVATDAHALACVWSATLMDGAPRFVTNGAGLDELVVGGLYLGLGDIVLAWGLVWLAWRFVAELRA